jgi:hypothetical protein
MSFKPIGSLLGSLTRRSKTPEAILALQVRQAAKETIERELFDMPKDLVDLIRIKSFKNGLLVVNAPPLLAAELSMRSGGLEKAINRTLGRIIIRSLRFKSS